MNKSFFIITTFLVIFVFIFIGCGIPLETSSPTLPNTTVLPRITGISANYTSSGKLSLKWDKSTISDFDHYSIYTTEWWSASKDGTAIDGIKPVEALDIYNVDTCTCQIDLPKYHESQYCIRVFDKLGNASDWFYFEAQY